MVRPDEHTTTGTPCRRDLDLRSGSEEAVTGVRRARLGRCLVDLVDSAHVLRILDGHLGRPRGTGTLLVASANLDHLTHFADRPDGEGLDPGRMEDWLVLLDGHPLVRAARRLSGTAYPRLAGADLLPPLLDLADVRDRSVAILGGPPELVPALGSTLRRRWPRLRVVGHLTPSRCEVTDPATARRIRVDVAARRPDLLVVALGKPLQERWMARHARETGALVAVGFGASVDFLAGTIPRAPRWMRESGLEWSYRLLREPRRMARRYLVEAPAALVVLRSDRSLLSVAPHPHALSGAASRKAAP